MESKKLNKKDKTIIALFISLLIIISIPLGIDHLEKVREATDLSNALALYVEIYGDAQVEPDSKFECTCQLLQKKDGWSTGGELFVSDISSESSAWHGMPTNGGTVKVIYRDHQISIYWE